MCTICPVCSSENIKEFFNKQNVPTNQNYLYNSKLEARTAIKGDLKLCFCEDCEFIFNAKFIDSKVLYEDNYNNTQDASSIFKKYKFEIINKLVKKYDLREKVFLEIGCGKGAFLKELISFSGGIGYGYDTSYEGEKSYFKGNLIFENKYYDDTCVDLKPDMVILRHVIEHVSEPNKLIKIVNSALQNSKTGYLYIETPCVEWILKNGITYDFFYEHCSYFSKSSLKKLLDINGYDIVEMEHTFSDQYIYVVAKIKDRKNISLLDSYIEKIKIKETLWNELINKYSGKIAIWGAGAKGVTFLNNYDKGANHVNYVIDINTDKKNKCIPITGHDIVSPSDITKDDIEIIIIMNWNYVEEIKSILKSISLEIILINGETL